MLTILGLVLIYYGSRGDDYSRGTRYAVGGIMAVAESGLCTLALIYVTYMAAYYPAAGDRHLPFLPSDWPRSGALETFAAHPRLWAAAIILYWALLCAGIVFVLSTARRGTFSRMIKEGVTRYRRGRAYLPEGGGWAERLRRLGWIQGRF